MSYLFWRNTAAPSTRRTAAQMSVVVKSCILKMPYTFRKKAVTQTFRLFAWRNMSSTTVGNTTISKRIWDLCICNGILSCIFVTGGNKIFGSFGRYSFQRWPIDYTPEQCISHKFSAKVPQSGTIFCICSTTHRSFNICWPFWRLILYKFGKKVLKKIYYVDAVMQCNLILYRQKVQKIMNSIT